MKPYKYLSLIVGAIMMLTSCGLDNYDAPTSKLQGRITYNGKNIGVRGTGEAVQLQLYQDGYALRAHIPVYVNQDGSFEATLFDGEYKLVTRNQNGPWVNTRDTTVINLRGSANVDLEVTPFFTISNESITMTGTTLNTSFNVNQIVNTAQIDYVMLLVSKTSFVDDVSYIIRGDFRNVEVGPQNLSMNLDEDPDFASAKYLFARVGVRAVGTDQAIYSDIVQLK